MSVGSAEDGPGDELNDACKTLVTELMNGDRHPIDDAKDVDVVSELDIEAVHEYRGYSIIIRWSVYTAWHDSDGPREEFNPFEVEVQEGRA